LQLWFLWWLRSHFLSGTASGECGGEGKPGQGIPNLEVSFGSRTPTSLSCLLRGYHWGPGA
jgi:hypothetical protein